jgi:hypothetical protein
MRSNPRKDYLLILIMAEMMISGKIFKFLGTKSKAQILVAHLILAHLGRNTFRNRQIINPGKKAKTHLTLIMKTQFLIKFYTKMKII